MRHRQQLNRTPAHDGRGHPHVSDAYLFANHCLAASPGMRPCTAARHPPAQRTPCRCSEGEEQSRSAAPPGQSAAGSRWWSQQAGRRPSQRHPCALLAQCMSCCSGGLSCPTLGCCPCPLIMPAVRWPWHVHMPRGGSAVAAALQVDLLTPHCTTSAGTAPRQHCSTQHPAHSTQHTAHSTQHTAHSTQLTMWGSSPSSRRAPPPRRLQRHRSDRVACGVARQRGSASAGQVTSSSCIVSAHVRVIAQHCLAPS